MSLKDQAFRVAVLGALKDAIATEWAEQRGQLLGQLLDVQQELGIKSLDVSLPDGTKVATVTLTQPSGKPEVVDEALFTQWVGEKYPNEVVRTVRPAFRKAILEAAEPAGEDEDGFLPMWDPKDGERIHGVVFRPGIKPNSFSVRYTPDGRAAIADAWQEGELWLSHGQLMKLEGGE